MNIHYLSGPLIHVGVSALLALLLRLNPVVAVLYGILPDLIDTPLALCGIAGGRFIGHTLLFAAVAIAAMYFLKRKYVWAAVVGITSHFLLDFNALIPWFYPFKSYDFPEWRHDFWNYFKEYLTLEGLGWEAIIVALAAIGILVYVWVRYRRGQRESREG